MLKEKTFDTGVVQINYAEGPASGPPMVLLHGGGDRWQHFLPIIPNLVMQWHVFALDLRGHGKSGRVAGQYRPEHYAEDVVAFLEIQVVDQAILFGHSLGGWIALLAAAQLKGMVRALILGDPPLNLEHFLAYEGSAERIDMWRKLRALAEAGLTVPEMASALADAPFSGAARSWAKTLSQVDPDVAQYHAEGRLDEYVENLDVERSLRRLSCPVLLLQGDQSLGGILSDDDVDHVLAILADGVYVRLDGRGHNLGLSAWEVSLLLQALTGFLGSL